MDCVTRNALELASNVPAPALLACVVLRLKPIPSLMLSKHSHQLSFDPSPKLPHHFCKTLKCHPKQANELVIHLPQYSLVAGLSPQTGKSQQNYGTK